MEGQGSIIPKKTGMESSEAAPAPKRGGVAPADAVSRSGLLIGWVALIAAFSIASPDIFLSRANFANILGSQATLVMLTIGMIIPLTVAEYDVSMAGVVSACLMLIGVLNVNYGWPIGVVVPVAFLLALAV